MKIATRLIACLLSLGLVACGSGSSSNTPEQPKDETLYEKKSPFIETVITVSRDGEAP